MTFHNQLQGCVAVDLLSNALMLISSMRRPSQVDTQLQYFVTDLWLVNGSAAQCDAITMGSCSAPQHSQ